MKKPLTTLAVLTLLVSSGTTVASGQSIYEELATYNPGSTAEDMRLAVEDIAQRTGKSSEQVAQENLEVAKASAEKAEENGYRGDTVFRSAKEGLVYVGKAENIGDFFIAPSNITRIPGVNHGHNALYVDTDILVEAPGLNRLSREVKVDDYKLPSGIEKYRVNTSQENRDAAARHAKENFIDKPYDIGFLNNKENGRQHLNCSELVWAAYFETSGIDLDSDGGTGVYPYDFQSSEHVTLYEEIKK
ncbi:MAG: YiiX/YebB-like N1pC/P60 family cysteine hydrolase [Rothia sp. (in: high G+C Gram-positive bacteria)]|uniref:hypothetical protein n=1 Tax=Rothia sp. (in: high G+C Gram-positive bacteria) TaxID=1885016 RepID=UPI002711829A|nr:YiiX/YebB-like N1pC/P60 family cysteine hydrolase [Rothia sp. (in: high G+C Gram-positive bacteria)]